MKTVTVTELLRGKITEALGAVEYRNEEVVITRRGKAIAKLVPMPPEPEVPLADPVADVIRRGKVPPSTKTR